MANKTTIGQQLSIKIKPFIEMGVAKPSDINPTLEDIAKMIDNRYSYLMDWQFKGRFTYDGLTYTKGSNDHSASAILKLLYDIEI